MRFYKNIIIILSLIKYCVSFQIIWDNDAPFEDNFIDDGRMDEVRMPNWFFIYPGTKWCGAGNIADDYQDLGEEAETDRCCRAHDSCDDIIEGFQTNHNLTNPVFYTRLNCRCDEAFHRCLKQVNDGTSTSIGQIYFTGLNTNCFRNDYPVTKCLQYTYFPFKKCKDYEYDTSKQQKYQWFDVPNY